MNQHHDSPNKKLKQDESSADSHNMFKESYKHYRLYKNKQTDFSELLDFNSIKEQQGNQVGQYLQDKYQIEYKQLDDKDVYIFDDNSVLIKQFIPICKQLEIGYQCLNKYINHPYRTNLFIYEKMNTGTQEVKKVYNKQKYLETEKYNFDRKIRWANIGYQYNWDCRNYLDTNTQIDGQLEQLIESSLAMVRNNQLLKNNIIKWEDYKPQTTIINYYSMTDHMGGHLDDGEPDQSHPIFSYSIGNDCVFLMGKRTKDIKPKAILLQAGDFYIMSGQSRLHYHGVPRIMVSNKQYVQQMQQYLDQSGLQNDEQQQNQQNDYQQVLNYLSENRINLNFRQVFL